MLNLIWWLFVILVVAAIVVMVIDLAIGAFVMSLVLFIGVNTTWNPLVLLLFWIAMFVAAIGICMWFVPNTKTTAVGRKLAKFAYAALIIVVLMTLWWPMTKTPAQGGRGPVAGGSSQVDMDEVKDYVEDQVEVQLKDERDDRMAQQTEIYADMESFEKRIDRKVDKLQAQADELATQLEEARGQVDGIDGIEQRLMDKFEKPLKELRQRVRELKQLVS